MRGFDSAKWNNEAKMIEEIAKDVLDKLPPTLSKDFEKFVGIEDHMAKMSELLQLESEEVRMVGIWGSSGIGKTTIARALFNQLSRNFQVSKFVDRAFVSKSKEFYSRANPDDHNMKLHLQESFLSEILGIKDIKIDHLGALGEKLQHQKVLIIIDDLDNLMVLEVLADKTQWFGSGSRIIVVTNDRHFLMAHRIDHIYEVSFPTEVQAFQMLCQSAFRKKYAPDGFEKLVHEVARHAGNLPLGLNVLGKYLQGQDKEYWTYMLMELQNGIDDENEKILRISYDRLDSKEKVIFRHIACLFNHMEETTIKSLLADSNLGVNIALKNLADKALIHVRHGHVVMHRLLQEMGKKIVRTQSIDKPGKREFLIDPNDICYVLSEGIGTPKVLGISLDTSEIDELHVHENAFKGMRNLHFLEIGSNYFQKEYTLHLPESFDYFPLRLQLLCWPKYPMSRMPSNFCPKNLVKIDMQSSKLEKLWEGVVSLTNLKEMDLSGSHSLKEIPDLSMATNLVELDFGFCWSLVELPSSIRNLNKLLKLNMKFCSSLETLPTGFNLKSLHDLSFTFCWQLKTFPEFSTNVSVLDIWGTNIEEFPSNLRLKNLVDLSLSTGSKWKQRQGVKNITLFMAMLSPTLTKLVLEYIPSLVELPSSIRNLNQLKTLWIRNCRNLEILPTGINLKSLDYLNLYGCSRLRTFPEISTNISRLDLQETGIEEVPWRIKNFSNLSDLSMTECINLKTLPTGINLKSLDRLTLNGCSRLRSFPEISTNISRLYLQETGIEEVPWRIENFSKLVYLSMRDCRRLKHVSLHISKLNELEKVDFSNCLALTRVDLSGNSSEVEMEADNVDTVPEEVSSSLSDDYVPKSKLDFSGCFNLDKEALLEQQQSVSFKSMIFPGEEVPSYFTHRTTGMSPLLDVPLSQPFFRFRACAVVVNVVGMNGVDIDINCQFKGRYGNIFDVTFSVHYFPKEIRNGSMKLLIFDCLHEDNAQRNYDHVDMQIHVRSHFGSKSVFQGWGIRLSEDCSSSEDRLGYPNTLQYICEAHEDNTVSDVCHETKYGENSDKDSEIYKFEVYGDSDTGSETDQFEECGDSETDQFEECGDSDIGNELD